MCPFQLIQELHTAPVLVQKTQALEIVVCMVAGLESMAKLYGVISSPKARVPSVLR